jgi:ABC-type multidrug transport system fused ATPase/permease subunit
LNQIKTFLDSFDALAHQFIGVEYPHGHWWIATVSILIFVIMPAWMAWHAIRFVRRHMARAQLRTSARSDESDIAAADALDRRGRAGIERTMLRWTLRSQIKLLLISSLAIPTTYALLDLPKHIVNHALAAGGPQMELLGVTVDQLTLLFVLCGAYLAAITLNGVIKYVANTMRGRVNERIVRRLRLAVVKARARQTRSENPAALISVAINECEPIGYFGGSMVTVPLIQGGTLLTSLVFLLVQDIALALAAVVMLPVQIALLPRLQQDINRTVRRRVHTTRSLSAALAEGAKGRTVTRDRQLRVRELEKLRIRINCQKARLKGLYTFTANLTPFFLFSIGGYLVINGRLSIGALVAALAAYKEINPSLRELFDFVQAWSDARARFEEVARTVKDAGAN